MQKPPIITFLTDFDPKDGYAGIMKGVILSINPQCQVVDLAQGITPQEILESAFVLGYSYRYFPKGSIHIVVVDPGVGSKRRPIALEANEHLFVGPDNGVFSFVYKETEVPRVFELSRREYFLPEISDTFHGRDIFSPVAAHLSRGVPLESLGAKIEDFVKIDIPEPRVSKKEIKGEVIYIDGFGNLVTNISRKLIIDFTKQKLSDIIIGKKRLDRILKCYSQAGEGELLGTFGSSGLLEISVNRGSAQLELNVQRGDSVRIILKSPQKNRRGKDLD